MRGSQPDCSARRAALACSDVSETFNNQSYRTYMPNPPTLNKLLLLALPLLLAPHANANFLTFSASGSSPGDIQATVDSFRASLGLLNPNQPGSVGSGRREINWDGVPQTLSSPNAFPGDFFNANTPGRARGIEFATPGTGFEVSANAGEAPIEFGNHNPGFPSLFSSFSAQKLFTAVGSTITDVSFFVPGSSVAAVIQGFGAVFSDVDASGSTGLQFYDKDGNLLTSALAPAASGNETFSFLGVTFDAAIVARVRIVSGNQVVSGGSLTEDLVVMDDFIYGEPRGGSGSATVPDGASTIALFAGAIGALLVIRRTVERQGC